MLPLFWRNYSIISKIHSYSPSIFTYNIGIVIIFFIWYLLLIISLMHSFCKVISFFCFWWIFILLILPIFWYNNTIIPKIVTNSISFIVSQLWIKLILFIWYYSLFNLFKCMNLILCQFLLVF